MVSVYYRDKSKVMRRIEGVSYGGNLLFINKSVYTLSGRFAENPIDIVYEKVK